ncbi:MAG TPA: hypothetical protein VFD16_02305 [Candidatus Saccharimonadales bacterium]|nr:hypothetical protein [Candidatus Saccharimonadales bacterium]
MKTTLKLKNLLITWFLNKKNRIPLLYCEEGAKIYERPIFKKFPYVEIVFPNSWDVFRAVAKYKTELFVGIKTSDYVTFMLCLELKVETSKEFKASDLEKLIALQKAKFPAQKKFEFVDCLEDFLIADCLRNHHFIKSLLEDYHDEKIDFFYLETAIMRMIKVPNLFTNVKKMELTLSDFPKRVVKLNPKVRLLSFSRSTAVL